MISINTKSTTPIFEQIVQQVGKYIALGVLKPHEQLPTVRVLAKELGINPNTVSKAYHECEMNELIYSIPGKGSFVTDATEGVNTIVYDAYAQFLKAHNQLKELGETEEAISLFLERNKL
ncbi:GntR family transcriptional regulator [Erysipelothrix sp. HDW6C]|uniref:GntR family transcriptional regulator n=1 Tax=Erysipelothrix sp. HDW6C TaxID=2714930 RepID=UPI001F112632|nr:GntR family transcriptional regulator [Erysipelothrix sp. HDW6C]